MKNLLVAETDQPKRLRYKKLAEWIELTHGAAEYQAGLYLKKQSRAQLNLNIVEELGSQALKTAPLRCGNYFR